MEAASTAVKRPLKQALLIPWVLQGNMCRLVSTAGRRCEAQGGIVTGPAPFAEIKDDVLAGRSLLWMAWNGRTVESAGATVLINSEIGKVCIITVCVGNDVRRWLPLIEQIESYTFKAVITIIVTGSSGRFGSVSRSCSANDPRDGPACRAAGFTPGANHSLLDG